MVRNPHKSILLEMEVGPQKNLERKKQWISREWLLPDFRNLQELLRYSASENEMH